MNTPAHAVFNLLVLGRRCPSAVALGAIAPDVPMFLFYGIQKLVLATPERVIWTTSYFLPPWQAAFDAVHSFPLVVVAAGLAFWAGSEKLVSFFSSMALHSVGDFFLHHDDAHRHFFPFSSFRFESPVSYWDPRYHGNVVAPLETLLVLGGAVYLMFRYRERTPRALLGGLLAAYGMYVGYALLVWS